MVKMPPAEGATYAAVVEVPGVNVPQAEAEQDEPEADQVTPELVVSF